MQGGCKIGGVGGDDIVAAGLLSFEEFLPSDGLSGIQALHENLPPTPGICRLINHRRL
jgi:hypothetical protein